MTNITLTVTNGEKSAALRAARPFADVPIATCALLRWFAAVENVCGYAVQDCQKECGVDPRKNVCPHVRVMRSATECTVDVNADMNRVSFRW